VPYDTWHCYTVTWPLMVQPMQHWRLCRRCACVLARIVLVSLPTLRCCRCQHCASVIALVARAPLPLLCWHCCPPCLCVAASIVNWHLPSHKAVATRVGVIASIAPLLLPELRRHCALVTWVSLPLSHWRCCPCHTRVAASITKWYLPSHDAVATHCR
jgi:hypothetical protein